MQKEIVIQKTLNNYLRSKNISQSKMARMMGVSTSSLHGLLNGSIPKGLLTLVPIADSLGVGLDEVVFGASPQVQQINSKDLWEITGKYELIIKKTGEVSCLE